jgi:hypothetical protein
VDSSSDVLEADHLIGYHDHILSGNSERSRAKQIPHQVVMRGETEGQRVLGTPVPGGRVMSMVAVNNPRTVRETKYPVTGESQGVDRNEHAVVITALSGQFSGLDLQKSDLPDLCPLPQNHPTPHVVTWHSTTRRVAQLKLPSD